MVQLITEIVILSIKYRSNKLHLRTQGKLHKQLFFKCINCS